MGRRTGNCHGSNRPSRVPNQGPARLVLPEAPAPAPQAEGPFQGGSSTAESVSGTGHTAHAAQGDAPSVVKGVLGIGTPAPAAPAPGNKGPWKDLCHITQGHGL